MGLELGNTESWEGAGLIAAHNFAIEMRTCGGYLSALGVLSGEPEPEFIKALADLLR
jgi:hypothetical protein